MKKDVLFYVLCIMFLIAGIFFDKTIVSFVSKFRADFFTEIMLWFSFFGTWFVVLIFMTSLFLWNEGKRKWVFPLWLSLGLSALITYLLKIIIMRARPEMALTLSETSSFPSGHATAVFSALPILYKEFPKFKRFWIGFAIVVAFSRLYLGAHYLTDVIVGALIGYTTGLIIVKYKTKSFSSCFNK